jgi:hypothetical protein
VHRAAPLDEPKELIKGGGRSGSTFWRTANGIDGSANRKRIDDFSKRRAGRDGTRDPIDTSFVAHCTDSKPFVQWFLLRPPRDRRRKAGCAHPPEKCFRVSWLDGESGRQ